MNTKELIYIAGQFISENEIESVKPLGEGFINDTYIVTPTNKLNKKLLLQRKNKNVFQNIPAMMENIDKVTSHLKQKINLQGGNPERESLTLVPEKNGKLFYIDATENYWTACLYIEDHLIYEKVDSSQIAYAGGKGIGRFQNMLADFQESLTDILPGFHAMRYRFKQWDEVLASDPVGRKIHVQKEIAWVEKRRNEMLQFWSLVEDGIIPKRVTHNDTKISNILFDKSGEFLCMIDLDTVLQSPALNDFGDAIRSYANLSAEDEPNLDLVKFDLERYREFTRGYLEEANHFLSAIEIEYLPFAARYITFEQMLRFLMDYIAGDTYYKIKYPEHNLIRTKAQHKLLQCMEDSFSEMQKITNQLNTKIIY